MKKITIMLDKERNMLFDLNTMSKYEDLTGKSSFSIGDDMGAKTIRALLFSCLSHEDESLTLENIGSMIDFDNMPYISQKLNEMITESTPKKTDDEEGKKEERQN